jgi:hypothetical protein
MRAAVFLGFGRLRLWLEVLHMLGPINSLFVRQIYQAVVMDYRHGIGLGIPDAPKLMILHPWDVSHSRTYIK